jgi:hypothetical protein
MLITVTASDEIVREAEKRGVSVTDFVQTLVARGLDAEMIRPAVNSAIERIRALRSTASASMR